MKLIYSRYMHDDLVYKFVPKIDSIWRSTEFSNEDCLSYYDRPLAGTIDYCNEKYYYHIFDSKWYTYRDDLQTYFDTYLLFKLNSDDILNNPLGHQIDFWFCA